MGARERYGDDPALTRATRIALLRVASAVAVVTVSLGLVAMIVVAKVGFRAELEAIRATRGLVLLVFLAVGALWVARTLALAGRRRRSAAGREHLPSDHPVAQILARLCALADLPRPDVVLVDSTSRNAWVDVQRDGAPVVCLTTGALESCSTAEIEAMLAHELFHVAHGDTGLALRLEDLAELAERKAPHVVWAYVLSSVRAMLRQREHSADRAAALLTGRPGDLASALRTCSSDHADPRDLREVAVVAFVARGGPDASARFATHPSTAERLEVLGRAAADLGLR